MNKFIIESPSAIGFRNCLIGSGDTEAAAWADAFGPKPWSPSAKRAARSAWAREVTPDELYDLECSSH
jgi:hypothetical protein